MLMIELEDAPEGAMAAALAKVANLARWNVLGLPSEGLRLAMPHRVFNLRTRGLADLSNNNDLYRATDAGGWRFIVADANGNPWAAVQTWEESRQWKVSSIRTGTWATTTKGALVGEGLPSHGTLAYLWCRRTWSAAIWLQTKEPSKDKVVPLPWVRVVGWAPLRPVETQNYLKEMQKLYSRQSRLLPP